MKDILLPALGVLGVVLVSFAAAGSEAGSSSVGGFDLRDPALHVPSSEPAPGATDREVEAPTTPPVRVASASLLGDELLEGILPWERWVSVSFIVDWQPATVAYGRFPVEVPRTSGLAEDLLRRSPDLVVLSPYNRGQTLVQLADVGVPTHVVRLPGDFAGLFSEWYRLAARVGVLEQARPHIEEAERRLREVEAIGSRALTGHGRRLDALLLQGTFAYGVGSLQGSCLEAAGLRSALGPEYGPTPQITSEQLLLLDPDLVFVAAAVDAPRRAQLTELPSELPFRHVRAPHRGRAYLVPGAWMAAISHHALLACEAYASTNLAEVPTGRTREQSP